MMNPRDFLNLASSLAMGDAEADWRSGANRAYYAAFHVARDLLQSSGFAVPRADTAHAYVWLRLNNCGHLDIEQAAEDLDEMRTLRNKADYDLHRPFRQEWAIDQVDDAMRVIEVLDAVAASPHIRAAITETMKLYERNVLKVVTWHS
jgi:uncharacterized protein (UPF0332 family)